MLVVTKLDRLGRNAMDVLLYHLVFPAKYRRVIFDKRVDEVLKEACLDIGKR